MLGLLSFLLSPAIVLAQAVPTDSAHTLIAPPSSPSPGLGMPMVMPGGGAGYVIGNTRNSQVVVMPGGGTATVMPNGNGTSTIQRSDGRGGVVNTPK